MVEQVQENQANGAPGGAQAPQANPEADHADAAYARRLRDALGGLGILGTLAAPQSYHQLLTLLVRNAMQVTGAKAGTLRLLDKTTSELVFEVVEGAALGPRAVEAARQFRVPLGQGIAGWVAASGQAVVRSDLAQDARLAAEATQR